MIFHFSRCGLAAASVLLLSGAVMASDVVTVPINLIEAKGVGQSVGTIGLSETANGFLRLDLKLTNELPPGGHGFHIHENGDCGPANKDGAAVAGLAAGGHFDPDKTGKHEGPSGHGHKGDLPILFVEVDEDGATETTHSLIAPRLKLAEVRGRSIMIHEFSDNYSDTPKPLGGGGARIACGVIPK
jgi:Cu-Zn family superoxide dismutase